MNVSAMLRPAIAGDADPGAERVQRAAVVRRSWPATPTGRGLPQDASYQAVFTSAADAFPGGAFRPFAPQINLRTFALQPTVATHLRLRVVRQPVHRRPHYAGEQDDDPRAATDCATASPRGDQVRIAEFQAFAF